MALISGLLRFYMPGPGCEDLFRVRQVLSGSSGSAAYRINQENSRLLPPSVCRPSPARRGDGISMQESETAARRDCKPGSSSKAQSPPVGKVNTIPWSQLEDLEQEIDDIRNRIDRESDDAKKIKDEVAFLKSCGTLLQTPAEIRNSVPSPQRQSLPERVQTSWRSWLLPLSPTANSEVNTKRVNDDLHAPLCAPTPAKECHGLLRGVKTPEFESSTLKRVQINLEPSLEALPRATPKDAYEFISHQEKNCGTDASLGFNDKLVPSESPSSSETSTKASSDASPESQEEPIDVPSLPFVSVERKPESTIGFERQRLGPKVTAGSAPPSILTSRSSDQVEDQKSDYSEHDASIDSLLEGRTRRCAKALEVPQNQNPWMRDVKTELNEGLSTLRTDSSPSRQNRLKILPPAHSSAIATSTEDDASKPTGVHQLRGSKCGTLSPILESGVSMDEFSSSCKENSSSWSPLSVKARQQVHARENSISPSNSSSHSKSIAGTPIDSAQCPSSCAKSISFTSTHSSNGAARVTDCISISDDALSERSSFENSLTTKNSDGRRFDGSEIHPSSVAQEDGISPSLSPSPGGILANHKGEPYICKSESAGSIAEKETIKSNVRGSDRYGVWNQESKPDYKTSGDDYDLFSDAVSRVSPECNARDEGVHGCADSPDSLNTGQFCKVVDPLYLIQKTPLKLCESIKTPEILAAGKHWRLHSNPVSSVLIPVENLSQWNRLKERKYNTEDCPKVDKTVAKVSSARQILASTERCDADKHQEMSGDVIRVDTSLSHWLKPSSPPKRVLGDKAKSKGTVRSPASHWGNQTPPSLVQGQRSPRGVANEGRILGQANCGNRSGWDGMGIPNSTTKYKEDQRVNWHETPFEVRLDRALDKQGVALQKKLFEGAAVAKETSSRVENVN